MTSGTATLIAAAIAATVSVLNLILTGTHKRDEETRIAIRTAAAEHINIIGRLIHEVIALSYIMSKSKSEQSHKEKHEKARIAADNLKEKRLDVRYSLWGIEKGLRALTRIPDWVAHMQADVRQRDKLLEATTKLGKALDEVIRKTYLTGAVPNRISRWKVNRKVLRVNAIYEEFQEYNK